MKYILRVLFEGIVIVALAALVVWILFNNPWFDIIKIFGN